jgi:hypothetical protein
MQASPYGVAAPAPKRGRGLLIGGIVVGVVVVLLCGIGIVAVLASGDSPRPRAAAGNPAPANGYVQPPDLCALADPVPFNAGTPSEGRVEKEDAGSFSLSGCVMDLQASDANNTLKVFAAVDGNARARHDQFQRAWDSGLVSGFKDEQIAGLGTKALYVVRQTAQNRRIEAVLGLYEANLYLEVRFIAGGSKEWDAALVKQRVLDAGRHAMSKVPRR